MAAVDVEVHTDSVEVVTDKVLTIAGSDTVNTTTNGTKTVDVQGNNYVLTSTGMYTGSMTGNIPTWLDEAITAKIVDGTVTLSQALSDLTTYVQNMEDGVNQSIVNLHNADENLNALYTTIKTSNDNNIAAISDLQLTKVDADSATAIAEQAVGSEFAGTGGDVASSWFLENIQTYADSINANTTATTALASSINDPDTGLEATADIIKTGYTTVGLNDDGTLNAGAGELGKIAVSMGTQTVSIDSEDTITIDEDGDYTATASKFLSDGDGAVVGWTASLIDDGVSKTSDLTFKADTFKIQATDSAYSPIEVDTTTGKLKFTGNVSFAGLGINGDSTTINGSLIATGKIESEDASTYFDLANNQIKMYNEDNGFTLDSTAAGTSDEPNIEGSYIKGGTIEGTTIEAVTINSGTLNVDTINSGDLTQTAFKSINDTYEFNAKLKIGDIDNADGAYTLVTANCTGYLYMDDVGGVFSATFELLRGSTVIATMDLVNIPKSDDDDHKAYYSISLVGPDSPHDDTYYLQLIRGSDVDNIHIETKMLAIAFKK